MLAFHQKHVLQTITGRPVAGEQHGVIDLGRGAARIRIDARVVETKRGQRRVNRHGQWADGGQRVFQILFRPGPDVDEAAVSRLFRYGGNLAGAFLKNRKSSRIFARKLTRPVYG